MDMYTSTFMIIVLIKQRNIHIYEKNADKKF